MNDLATDIETEQKPFIRPEGHNCKISSHTFDCLTFGTGRLEDNGCWEHGCPECTVPTNSSFQSAAPAGRTPTPICGRWAS